MCWCRNQEKPGYRQSHTTGPTFSFQTFVKTATSHLCVCLTQFKLRLRVRQSLAAAQPDLPYSLPCPQCPNHAWHTIGAQKMLANQSFSRLLLPAFCHFVTHVSSPAPQLCVTPSRPPQHFLPPPSLTPDLSTRRLCPETRRSPGHEGAFLHGISGRH